MVGRTIGNYEVLAKLGEGGMGTVYKARDKRLKRLVALKFLSRREVDSTTKARFLREAQAASALSHPNIVTIYDIGEQDGTNYIVMEYIDGQALNDMIPPGGLPVGKALDYLIQLGEALAAAHSAGIVHRDLKPGNVIVDRNERLKVLDFGLAKFKVTADSSRDEDNTQTALLTKAGTFLGTIAYVSPEQSMGAEVDLRSDIFSFGVVTQELLTGRRPFSGASQWALLHEISHGKPRPLRAAHPHLPESLEILVAQMLAKRPEDRLRNMQEALLHMHNIRLGLNAAPETVTITTFEEKQDPLATEGVKNPPSTASEKVSIGVLMFRSLSPDPQDRYLAEGIASEIVQALSGIPSVRVVSQLASFRFKDEVPDLALVAQSLNIRYVLTGSVRRAGQKIRVMAELDDAAAGTQLWSHTYDRGIEEDVFAVQEEIAKAIVGATAGQLIRARAELASHLPAETLDAPGLVRKAYHFTNQAYHGGAMDEAVDLLRKATEIDPDYAAAHAYLGSFIAQRVVANSSSNEAEDRAEALAAAEHALLLAPSDAEVLENSGLALLHCGRFEKAVTTLRRAVEIAPFNLVAWGYLGLALGWGGAQHQIPEAHAILDRLIADAPDHPSMPYWLCFQAGTFCREGKHQESADCARRSITLQPRFAPSLIVYANAMGHLGRFPEAGEMIRQLIEINPHGTQEAYMSALLTTTGARERAQPHIGGLIAAGIFKGDLPWPVPVRPDPVSKRPTSA
jgi:serine/threonine protein kinase/tetratricopeptide (TPR) repeat protein